MSPITPSRPAHGLRRGLVMDRRAVLTLLGVTAAGGALSPASALTLPQQVPRYVITDLRHPQSLAFGQALARQGSVRLEVTDGLTALWRDALQPLWRSSADAAVMGLTSREVWACLGEQARGQGRRMVLLTPPEANAASLLAWSIR